MNFRPQRVGKLIREQLSDIIGRELEFPGALVTITEVEVGKKMDSGRVLVSVWPQEKGDDALRTLNDASRTLQFQLSRTLNIKPMPELVFQLDAGLENAAQVEKALLEGDGAVDA